ncbi:hypothetical protein BD770DRAFT_404844 [Pilaira anomala]|nr:hypothetical protein BD770DRAFT_404844 [Pilaira anomala]
MTLSCLIHLYLRFSFLIIVHYYRLYVMYNDALTKPSGTLTKRPFLFYFLYIFKIAYCLKC